MEPSVRTAFEFNFYNILDVPEFGSPNLNVQIVIKSNLKVGVLLKDPGIFLIKFGDEGH